MTDLVITQTFEEAYNVTLEHERGYVNHPKDPGGETIDGIARKMHPNWVGWPLIDKLTTKNYKTILAIPNMGGLIKLFYFQWWCDLKCDAIERIDPKIAKELFESSFNCGPSNGAKFLQRSLNNLNGGGKHYKEIVVDGKLGPGTIATLETCCKLPGRKDLVYRCQNGEQYKHYDSLKNKAHFPGWWKRIDGLDGVA